MKKKIAINQAALPTLAALVMASCTGTALAETVDMKADIAIESTLHCGIEVMPPDNTATSMTYRPAREGEEAKMVVDRAIEGDLVIQANGGAECKLPSSITIHATGDRVIIDGQPSFGQYTRAKTGAFRSILGLTEVHATDAAGNAVPEDGMTLRPQAWQYGPMSVAELNGLPVVPAGTLRNFFPNTNKQPSRVVMATAQTRAGSAYGGFTGLAVNPGDTARPTIITFPEDTDAKTMRLTPVAWVSPHPVNVSTGQPDDSTVTPGESIDIATTLTVTSS